MRIHGLVRVVGLVFVLGCEGETSGGTGGTGSGGTGSGGTGSGGTGSGGTSGQGGSSSGGAGGSGGRSSAEIWIAYCNDEAPRAQSCGDDTFTIADCASYAPCTSLYKPAAVEAITTCLLVRECGASDDACSSDSLIAGSPTPSVATFKAKCSSYVDACEAAGTPIWEDLAAICLANQLADDFGPAFDGCFSKSCTEFRGCFDEVAANHFGCAK